ncbi:thioredoxin-1-like [Contarinia nasturtii]|uniref:thioredoxin-1-like n=1 Tax=Contarinia nasturtii TaxID=265458 RepID=UPI0012D37678|nr:thioredoxin-1-like [Contarinia nasturtii]
MCLILSCFCVGHTRTNSWLEIGSMAQFDYEMRNAIDRLIVVEFYYSWCDYSKLIVSSLDLLALKYSNVIMLRVDIDKFKALAARYNVIYSPTFVYLRFSRLLEIFTDANVNRFEHVLNKRLRYL